MQPGGLKKKKSNLMPNFNQLRDIGKQNHSQEWTGTMYNNW